LADHWLRSRDGLWQLKCPPEGQDSSRSHKHHCSQYEEIEDTAKILTRICQYLPQENDNGQTLEELINGAILQVIAEITTKRTSYEIEGLRVDLDTTNFGYGVGEVEMVVSSEEDVPAATADIAQLVAKLAASSSSRIPGKIETYLYRYKPEIYKTLVAAKRITATTS